MKIEVTFALIAIAVTVRSIGQPSHSQANLFRRTTCP